MPTNPPQEITVAEALDLQRVPKDGMEVGEVRGKLTRVYPRKAGEGQYGPWSFQNLELEDGKEKIKVVLKDRDELDEQDWKGARVVISPSETKQGWRGVKVKDDEDKRSGKSERVFWITGSANIEEDRGGAPAPRDREPRREPSRSQTRDARPAREERRNDPEPRQEPRQQQPAASAGKRWIPLGPTVGMAINCACANITARGEDLDPTRVWEIASDLLRVARRLDGGNLAAPLSERAGKAADPAPTQPAPPAPPAASATSTNTDEPPIEGDDVPF